MFREVFPKQTAGTQSSWVSKKIYQCHLGYGLVLMSNKEKRFENHGYVGKGWEVPHLHSIRGDHLQALQQLGTLL